MTDEQNTEMNGIKKLENISGLISRSIETSMLPCFHFLHLFFIRIYICTVVCNEWHNIFDFILQITVACVVYMEQA